MPLPGHKRTQSTPEKSPLKSLAAASQTLAGVGSSTGTLSLAAPAAAAGHREVENPRQRQTHGQQPQRGMNPAKGSNPSANSGLRVQTSAAPYHSAGADDHSANSGVTDIYSGGSSLAYSSAGPTDSTADLPIPRKSTITFQLPSPNPGGQQQQQQQQQRLPPPSSHQHPQPQHQELFTSPQDLHAPPLLQPLAPLRGHDPVGKIQPPPSSAAANSTQTYTAYHATNSSSLTGSRPGISARNTAPSSVSHSRPQMHRTNTGGAPPLGQNYPSNPTTLNTSSAAVDPGRKYTHTGALTPTYPNSSQHSSSQSHGGNSASSHLGMGLAGLTGSSNSMREREEPQPAVGATGSGRWMSAYGMYAVDWCKWPVQSGNGYGRIAVGSYSEDSHNYVGFPTVSFVCV